MYRALMAPPTSSSVKSSNPSVPLPPLDASYCMHQGHSRPCKSSIPSLHRDLVQYSCTYSSPLPNQSRWCGPRSCACRFVLHQLASNGVIEPPGFPSPYPADRLGDRRASYKDLSAAVQRDAKARSIGSIGSRCLGALDHCGWCQIYTPVRLACGVKNA
jgi:hypothetical protein